MTLPLAALLIALGPMPVGDTLTVEERIDLYDPASSAYMGSEVTWFGPDGRRLRQIIYGADGTRSLLFILLHDEDGRESGAVYFEGDAQDPTREAFTFENGGRLQVTTYYPEPGQPGERTESDLDEDGREVRKRYYRTDGSQYGAEDVLWNDDGTKAGWDFRFVEREGGASFRYDYREADDRGRWIRRIRLGDGSPERVEMRTLLDAAAELSFPEPARLGPGMVSTDRAETSPSMTADGRTLVFARYDDDWYTKEPFMAELGDDGWTVRPLPELGVVYNVSISPDGGTLIYATRTDDARTTYRVTRVGDGWSESEDLTAAFGIAGTYNAMTDNGDLYFFNPDGADGLGIYHATVKGSGFATPRPVFIPDSGEPFDAFVAPDGSDMIVTMCFDAACRSGEENGFWWVSLPGSGEASKLPNLPYGWGAQPAPALGLFIYTDGSDILALPLDLALSTTPPSRN